MQTGFTTREFIRLSRKKLKWHESEKGRENGYIL